MGLMRIGSFRIQPDKIEEFLKIYVGDAIPVIKSAHGNMGAFILQDNNDRNYFQACTAWKTKEDAENYDKSGVAMEMVNKVKHTFDGPPTLTTFTVYGI